MIAADLTVARPPFAGVQTVTRSAGEALAERDGADAVFWLAAGSPALRAECRQQYAPSCCSHPAARLLWQQCRLPTLLRQAGADRLFAPAGTAPLRCPCPVTLLVHDLIAFTNPPLCRPLNGLQMRTLGAASIRRAERLITASRTVADDIIRLFDRRARDIQIVPFPPDPSLFLEQPPIRHRNELLFLGTIEPRKGLDLLLSAFRISASKHPDLRLVCIGRPADRSLVAELRRYEGPGAIEYRGYQPRAAVAAALHEASACILPSQAEGFGLPIIEALACGTPVIHSSHPALLEAAEGNGLAFTDHSAAGLAAVIDRLLAAPSADLTEISRRLRGRTWQQWIAAALPENNPITSGSLQRTAV